LPSPPWAWQVAQCLRKTSLPLVASPAFFVTARNSSRTFCRSGLGRPPPLVRIAFARSAILLSGWAARACFWSSDSSPSGTCPFRGGVGRGGGGAAAAGRAGARGGGCGGRPAAEPLQHGGADLGGRARPDRLDEPGRQLGPGPWRNQVEQLFRQRGVVRPE